MNRSADQRLNTPYRFSFLRLPFCLLFLALLLPLTSLQAQNASRGSGVIRVSTKRNPAFRVPSKMKPRVQFWVDVFSKYGKHNAIIHHRQYPHIIFDVLDFYDQAKTKTDSQVERYRKGALKKKFAQIRTVFKHLSAGGKPRNAFETHVAQQMSVLGGGTKKYRDVVKNDWIRSQRGIRERYREAIERSGRYIHILEQIFVAEHGLPIELTRLPFVESSFDYKAYSSVGAAGIWQFMPATGRIYDLRVSKVVDERRDVTSATTAAARYLSDAYQKLGTWPLALTSYNHGVYGVLKKVKKLGTKDIARIVERANDQPFGFASQNFYPEFLAALQIYEDPQRYFPGVVVEEPIRIARRKLTRSTSVGSLSKKLGVSVSALKEVNYALHSNVWKGRYSVPAGYTLNVPVQHKQALASLKLPPPSSTSSVVSQSGGSKYRVRRGDTLGGIARRHGISVSSLKSMNGLRSDLVRVGQVLVVSNKSSSRPKARSITPSGSHTYTVRSGDTLFDIARAHRTTVSALKRANGMSSSRIRIGQKLKLPQGSLGGSGEDVLYRVKKGDSLWIISKRFGVSQSSIRTRNKLRSSSLRIGQKIYIPR